MTWEIFLGIVALFGFIVAVMTPIIKLNTSITKLNSALELLQSSMTRLESDNTESHRRIWTHNEAQDRTIQNHEKRISDMEHVMELNQQLHGILGVKPASNVPPLPNANVDLSKK